MHIALTVLPLLAFSGAAQAQMTREQCRALADGLGALSAASSNVQRTLGKIDITSITATAPANVRKAAPAAESARIKLVLALNDYAGLSETLVAELRKCALR